MRIRPLSGQVLIALLPEDEKEGDLFLPDKRGNKEEKRPPRKGIVKAMGPWRRGANGYCILPPFCIGNTVLIDAYKGQKLNWRWDQQLRLIDSDDVIALLTEVD